jgi:cytoskeletal protein CcmA (bactofilin family)
MIFRSDNSEGELNGFVDAGTVFRGELQFETTFRVEGKVEGTIVSNGTLVVGEGGVVEGEIRVAQVFVSGTVRGKVHASRRLQICKEGKAFADLETPSLVIEDGAILEGRCTMTREGEARPAEAGGRPAPVQPLHSLPTRHDRQA